MHSPETANALDAENDRVLDDDLQSVRLDWVASVSSNDVLLVGIKSISSPTLKPWGQRRSSPDG